MKNKRKAQRHRRTLPTNQRVEGLKVSSVVDESKNVPCEVSLYFLCTLEVFFLLLLLECVRYCFFSFWLCAYVYLKTFIDMYVCDLWVYGCMDVCTYIRWHKYLFFLCTSEFFSPPRSWVNASPLSVYMCMCIHVRIYICVCAMYVCMYTSAHTGL